MKGVREVILVVGRAMREEKRLMRRSLEAIAAKFVYMLLR
jgi:hypothetical protein